MQVGRTAMSIIRAFVYAIIIRAFVYAIIVSKIYPTYLLVKIKKNPLMLIEHHNIGEW